MSPHSHPACEQSLQKWRASPQVAMETTQGKAGSPQAKGVIRRPGPIPVQRVNIKGAQIRGVHTVSVNIWGFHATWCVSIKQPHSM